MEHQIVITSEDSKILRDLRRTLSRIQGIQISRTKTRKSGIEKAYEDVRNGRVNEYDSIEDMFSKLGYEL